MLRYPSERARFVLCFLTLCSLALPRYFVDSRFKCAWRICKVIHVVHAKEEVSTKSGWETGERIVRLVVFMEGLQCDTTRINFLT